MNYYDLGYQKFYASSLKNKVKKINHLLKNLLGIESRANFPVDLIHHKLLEMFKDVDYYLGFLRAFANHPLVQSITFDKKIIKFAKQCGIDTPTLVTNPILHVVANDLLLNPQKVFTPPHQDCVSTKGSVNQLVFWIPLHKIDRMNFGIDVYPKTHLLGKLETENHKFGHMVKENLVTNFTPEYVNLKLGQGVAFSQYLVHKTNEKGRFRMALSFRFNDMSNHNWQKRKFFVPFERAVNDLIYTDGRHEFEISSSDFFKSKR